MSKIGYIRVSTEHQETARQSVNSSNSDSVRASRSLRHRENIQAGSRFLSTGRNSDSSMGNGKRRTSQAGTLCGKWA